jgi:hypothetical protein
MKTSNPNNFGDKLMLIPGGQAFRGSTSKIERKRVRE